MVGLPLWLSWYRFCLQCGRPGFDPCVGKILWRREMLLTLVFWPGEFHGLFMHGVAKESVLRIRYPKYWSFSFSISPSNEYSGLISFRMDWFDLLAVQGTFKSSPIPQFKSISSSVLSFLYSPTLTCIHDYWKNHSFD